eukprot:6213924-Pleurochrysis_carterae.AAC.7
MDIPYPCREKGAVLIVRTAIDMLTSDNVMPPDNECESTQTSIRTASNPHQLRVLHHVADISMSSFLRHMGWSRANVNSEDIPYIDRHKTDSER